MAFSQRLLLMPRGQIRGRIHLNRNQGTVSQNKTTNNPKFSKLLFSRKQEDKSCGILRAKAYQFLSRHLISCVLNIGTKFNMRFINLPHSKLFIIFLLSNNLDLCN